MDSEKEEIKQIIKKGQDVIGTKEVLKQLKLGTISKVFVTVNCPDEIKESIAHYAGIASVEIVNLKQPNDELGILCKKPFSISVLGLKKGA